MDATNGDVVLDEGDHVTAEDEATAEAVDNDGSQLEHIDFPDDPGLDESEDGGS